MADISILNTFTEGLATDAGEVAKNIYFPERTWGEAALSVINGNLESENRDSNWDVSSNHIRPNSCNGGLMVAQNAPLDYTQLLFPESDEDAHAYTPIPGAGLSFYLPYDPRLVIFTWQIFIGQTSAYITDDKIQVKFNIDAEAQAGQLRVVPQGRTVASTGELDHFRDRMWSGHKMKTDMTQGWHNAYLSIWLKDTATILAEQDQILARVRNRNLKVIWFA